jgi:ABC-2 type transport system permease protein
MIPLNTTLSTLLMILLPVALAATLRRRYPTAWLLFCAGMLTFTVSQIVHLPLNAWLAKIGLLPQTGVEDRPLWQTALVLGLTAGLCEELARTAGYALLRRVRGVYDGVMLGLGHGGIESMVFGGVLTAASISSLLPLVGKDLSQINLLPAQIEAVQTTIQRLMNNPWNLFLPVVERLMAIAIHVVLSLIVLQAFRRRQPLYVLLAIVFHAVIDMVAVLASSAYTNAGLVLGIEALLMLPGWIWMALFLRRQPLPTTHHPTPIAEELRVFGVALRKEFLQVWRTRRVIIVAAVFGLFGLASPLMAYFMPQMMKAIPGAEQFASLIPTPSQADALIQYVKNISQFGFLLAILLGIGDVAGEKERGTAGMILSKPMTRWAFVTSKYLAQVGLYLMGFLLAAIGGYLYTWVLFEPGDPLALLGVFGLINGLLFAWLLPYVTITLVSSVLANSTSTAAGISVAGAIVLMITGNIPQIAQLMPGALTGWANALGTSTSPPPFNGGALAMCLVFAVVGLVLGIGLFESQEL